VKILGDLAEASLTVPQMQSVPYGTLRISASTVFGVTVLNGWISEFIYQYPKVNVEVLLTNQYVDLVTRGIDVVFSSGPLADSEVVAQSCNHCLSLESSCLQALGVCQSHVLTFCYLLLNVIEII
jgi:DNA-binding transcriptional LysR family regulator